MIGTSPAGTSATRLPSCCAPISTTPPRNRRRRLQSPNLPHEMKTEWKTPLKTSKEKKEQNPNEAEEKCVTTNCMELRRRRTKEEIGIERQSANETPALMWAFLCKSSFSGPPTCKVGAVWTLAGLAPRWCVAST
ncbi:hypothetical protein KC19_VG010800 [Ceratodon purpureus]|uniref:Uncharacterized protein n=1 Tax=Ceratodon purpureus TaxID=3225 RepID=A0A8T0HL36_CERPU|nr:hypothetical protein KC19_VG010800 [Ceratodon purpureus]